MDSDAIIIIAIAVCFFGAVAFKSYSDSATKQACYEHAAKIEDCK